MPSSLPPLRDRLAADLAAHRLSAEADPFANPILSFARDLALGLADGSAPIDDLAGVVQAIAAEGFMARAERLGAYLGEPDPERDRAALSDLFEALAELGEFEAYARAVARPAYGAVFTAHPTFALNRELSLALVELATGFDRAGKPLGEAGRAERRRLAETHDHGPPPDLTLDLEHDWSVEALENAHAALDAARRAAIAVARRRWPDRWRELSPRLAILSTWVGFDTDGRNDVTWLVSLEKRLDLKRRALQRCRRALTGMAGPAAEAVALLDGALGVTVDQLSLAAAARADPTEAPALARAMVAGRAAALVDPAPLARLLDAAIAEADDAACETLLAVRAMVAAQGLSLAQVQVRLNAAQLHSAIRGEIDLATDPADPANRRAYFAAAEDLLTKAQPRRISFGSLVDEPSPAKRLMMSIAQTLKTIDAVNPVRFLIAEAESGFTLLAALYYARLYGVEDKVEISPLFETENGLARGEALFEEALKSHHYREHLQRQGRLAVEFGFSDSGRFIGQMAATFRIERLQLRIAELLEAEKLPGLEVVLFDTHGESIGRGGHPRSLADRLRYAAPPRARLEFLRRGHAVREETSFQGGEGYLPFFTPVAALATVRGVLEFAYGPAPEAEGDPIYKAPEFASDFFATIQQAFSDLTEDPDYAALLSLFETRLLHRTGSRPVQRQGEGQGRPRTLRDVGELRAIPNNGVLQQLGYLANSVYGVGKAASKDLRTYAVMWAASPRFNRGFDMARQAFRLSDLAVIEAYTSLVDPGLWLARRTGAEGADARAFDCLATLSARLELHEPLERVVRDLQAEDLRLKEAITGADDPRRARLLLLHGIRVAAMQEIARLAGSVPPFPLNSGLSRDQVQERLMRMDIPAAVTVLAEVFPLHEPEGLADADWGEPSDERADASHGHAQEHESLFKPLLALHALALAVTSAATHEIGACG